MLGLVRFGVLLNAGKHSSLQQIGARLVHASLPASYTHGRWNQIIPLLSLTCWHNYHLVFHGWFDRNLIDLKIYCNCTISLYSCWRWCHRTIVKCSVCFVLKTNILSNPCKFITLFLKYCIIFQFVLFNSTKTINGRHITHDQYILHNLCSFPNIKELKVIYDVS